MLRCQKEQGAGGLKLLSCIRKRPQPPRRAAKWPHAGLQRERTAGQEAAPARDEGGEGRHGTLREHPGRVPWELRSLIRGRGPPSLRLTGEAGGLLLGAHADRTHRPRTLQWPWGVTGSLTLGPLMLPSVSPPTRAPGPWGFCRVTWNGHQPGQEESGPTVEVPIRQPGPYGAS